MSTHVYSFGPDLYLQCTGGPIGMRFTASLANVVMKQWDKMWVKLLNREGVKFDLFVRYVDDCRLFMQSLNPGWRWSGHKFEYSSVQRELDEAEGISHVARTTREITKAMCDLTDFLTFTGEDCEMFADRTLPTLDTTIWVEEGKIMHKFWEKPTVGNQVLRRDTALPIASLRASLLQETVRRLQNCSETLDIGTKQDILSRFGTKLINSGHSVRSARVIIVQGVVKYLHKLECSKLPADDVNYRPLYLDKSYQEDGRQIDKFRARMDWYKSKKRDTTSNVDNMHWRRDLRGVWRGNSMNQKPVLETGYSSVVVVPNTPGARLAHKFIRCEDRLAKITKYNVKVIEQSGIQLIRLFPRVMSPSSCHWPLCPVCTMNESKGGSKCRSSNVVYEAKCTECVEDHENGLISKDDIGIYIGETSRTLVERATEHIKAADDLDVKSFIMKHWASKHGLMETRPRVQFSVIKQCKDALSRQVSEALFIESRSNLNSRAEWGRNTISRLRVEQDPWTLDKSLDEDSKSDVLVQEFLLTKGLSKKKSRSGKIAVSSTKGVKTDSMIRLREHESPTASSCSSKRRRLDLPLKCRKSGTRARTYSTLKRSDSQDRARTRSTLRPCSADAGWARTRATLLDASGAGRTWCADAGWARTRATLLDSSDAGRSPSLESTARSLPSMVSHSVCGVLAKSDQVLSFVPHIVANNTRSEVNGSAKKNNTSFWSLLFGKKKSVVKDIKPRKTRLRKFKQDVMNDGVLKPSQPKIKDIIVKMRGEEHAVERVTGINKRESSEPPKPVVRNVYGRVKSPAADISKSARSGIGESEVHCDKACVVVELNDNEEGRLCMSKNHYQCSNSLNISRFPNKHPIMEGKGTSGGSEKSKCAVPEGNVSSGMCEPLPELSESSAMGEASTAPGPSTNENEREKKEKTSDSVVVRGDSNSSVDDLEVDVEGPLGTDKTSTPKKGTLENAVLVPITRKQRKRVSKPELEAARKRLDEGQSISLGPELSLNRSCNSDGTRGQLVEFESMSSVTEHEVREMLDGLNDESSWEGSDPDVTNLLLGLLGESNEKFSSPF